MTGDNRAPSVELGDGQRHLDGAAEKGRASLASKISQVVADQAGYRFAVVTRRRLERRDDTTTSIVGRRPVTAVDMGRDAELRGRFAASELNVVLTSVLERRPLGVDVA